MAYKNESFYASSYFKLSGVCNRYLTPSLRMYQHVLTAKAQGATDKGVSKGVTLGSKKQGLYMLTSEHYLTDHCKISGCASVSRVSSIASVT